VLGADGKAIAFINPGRLDIDDVDGRMGRPS
jgi:hypothetical protein